ncbi:Rieske (2Fe-2S) domain protein [Psychromonas ingrahamii 37]|uniref:Rieske (2Fe-2S) domain protein n=1 Tax=Psychromonas ingrahamii (strain DSM 17664 / CCUG 51855 / 37) TaxID=357804 RepID=A1SV00_PSYIN|nr:non-heme iron oxygenase ferredoxin subunit [Psychromonas ingrahamii]ABM03315.1 Rieske (2Fe-2S) domain protein [Psychromonas ingrahamii 37]
MAKWISVLPADELSAGMTKVLALDQIELLLINIAGEFFAIENRCSHDGGELNGGEICAAEITCPRHGARFNIKTGAVLSAPAFENIATYPVRIIDNEVQVFLHEK